MYNSQTLSIHSLTYSSIIFIFQEIQFSNKYYFLDIIFIFMEDVMFEVTSTAVENLKAYLSQNNIDSAVRIALMQGG